MYRDEIFKRLETIRNLPTLPVVISELRKVTRNPRSDAKRIANVIEDDPAMMARILKVVNSAFYGGVEPIASIQQAVARIGFNAVNNIALSTSVFSAFGGAEHAVFDRKEFWRHSVSTGVAIGVLYKRVQNTVRTPYRQDQLHLAGLLHDIGKVVLEQFFHEEFAASIRYSIEQRIPLYQSEMQQTGTTHAEVGAWLAEKWHLPDELVEVVRWHHDPESGAAEHHDLIMLCHSANHICNIKGLGNSGDSAKPLLILGTWQHFGLEAGDVPDIVLEVVEESEKSDILLSLV